MARRAAAGLALALVLAGCRGLLDLPDDLGFESSGAPDAPSGSPHDGSAPDGSSSGSVGNSEAASEAADAPIDPCVSGFCENFDGPSSLSAWTVTSGGSGSVTLTSTDVRSSPHALLVQTSGADAFITRALTIPNALTCDFELKADSFGNEARFFSLKNTDYGNPDYFEVEWGKKDGQIAMWQYAFLRATGAQVEDYPIDSAPPANTWQHVRVAIIMTGTSRLATVDITGGGHLQADLPSPSTTQFQLRFGLMSVGTAAQIRVDDIVCAIR
jgi:hypothetical protein